MTSNSKITKAPPSFGSQYVEDSLEGRTIEYRAWEGLPYCAAPVDPIQRLNLFVPECLYDGTGTYTLATAPIFMPNTVGGYMPGPAGRPEFDPYVKGPNNIFCALKHGYVVVSAGVRGRASGTASAESFVGGAFASNLPEAYMS